IDAALILQFVAGLIPGLPASKNAEPADGVLDAFILQVSVGLLPSLHNEPNADVNLDGGINAVDAALILQYVAGLISSLPP
ncbi:MAG: hypothetical protein Q8S13_10530, partial [Dehalococcoidia bacterium]|nr:hypothetical protein [Dehalococcoidia bacterium]